MTRRLISTGSALERSAGYSRAVVSGEFCFVAGTTGYDYTTMVMPDAPADQVRNAVATIVATLDEAGFALQDVVRARFVVSDRAWLAEVYAELGRAFGDIRPAATMTVGELVEPVMKFEIDVTAHRVAGSEKGSDAAAVDRALRARRTAKLLLPPEQRAQGVANWTAAHVAELQTMVEGAAWAPFHKRASERARRGSDLDAVMPWRFTIVQGQACDELLDWLRAQAESQPDSMWSRAWRSKIKDMLGACGALVQASWLPDIADGEPAATLTLGNVEHIAAASAAVQNLLLAASVRGWSSYWSSGGILREPAVFERLGMDARESLLGAIFLSPDVAEGVTVIGGGLRDERGPVDGWVRWVPART